MKAVRVALILPAVAVLCAAEAWRKGLVWPVVTTLARCLAKPEPCNEADVFG